MIEHVSSILIIKYNKIEQDILDSTLEPKATLINTAVDVMLQGESYLITCFSFKRYCNDRGNVWNFWNNLIDRQENDIHISRVLVVNRRELYFSELHCRLIVLLA